MLLVSSARKDRSTFWVTDTIGWVFHGSQLKYAQVLRNSWLTTEIFSGPLGRPITMLPSLCCNFNQSETIFQLNLNSEWKLPYDLDPSTLLIPTPWNVSLQSGCELWSRFTSGSCRTGCNLPATRLLHSLSLVAVELSVGYDLWVLVWSVCPNIIPVKLPWIFPGAPLIFNGAPRNIQGKFDRY